MKKMFITVFAFLFFQSLVYAESVGYMNLDFWNKFNDETLIQNLMTVYQNNTDLKAAVIKVREANRIVKMSFADELPYVGFQGYVGHVFNSSDEKFGKMTIPDYTQSHFLFPITMNYEIDIWGKNHLKTKSKKKQLEMIKQDEKAAYIYISSAFAACYYNLIRVDKLIEYQKQLVELQRKIIDSYKIKYECGTATLTDIELAEKNMTFLKEELANLIAQQDTIKRQMSVLLADRRFSDITRISYDDIKPTLKSPDSIKFEILDNRPDRVKSQLDLEKIGIDVRVAKKDLLPKFVITGNIGFNFYNMSTPHNFLANIGVVPSWDLFAGGRKLQMLKLQKDKYDTAIQNYEKTILIAIQESNDALYTIKTAEQIKNITDYRLKTDENEMQYVIIREDAGTADNMDLLFQKQKLITTKMQSVTAKINEVIAVINLYQALGGYDFLDECI